MSHEMIRAEAEAVYGKAAVDRECNVTVEAGDRAEDIVDVWPLLPAADDGNPTDAEDAPAEDVLDGEPEVDDAPAYGEAETSGPVYEDSGDADASGTRPGRGPGWPADDSPDPPGSGKQFAPGTGGE